jgi:hypothetical protein
VKSGLDVVQRQLRQFALARLNDIAKRIAATQS